MERIEYFINHWTVSLSETKIMSATKTPFRYQQDSREEIGSRLHRLTKGSAARPIFTAPANREAGGHRHAEMATSLLSSAAPRRKTDASPDNPATHLTSS